MTTASGFGLSPFGTSRAPGDAGELAQDIRAHFAGAAPKPAKGAPGLGDSLVIPGQDIRDPDRAGGIGGRALERAMEKHGAALAKVAKSTEVPLQNPFYQPTSGEGTIFIRQWAEESARRRAVLSLLEKGAEPERRAYGRIERGLELAVDGDVEAVAKLIHHVGQVPEAFPPAFRDAIAEAPQRALREAAWGLIHAL